MIKKYYDADCNLGLLDGKTIAIMGYGSQGQRVPPDLRLQPFSRSGRTDRKSLSSQTGLPFRRLVGAVRQCLSRLFPGQSAPRRLPGVHGEKPCGESDGHSAHQSDAGRF